MNKTWLGAVALGLLVAVACGNDSASPTTDAPGGGGDGQGGAKDDEKPGHAGKSAEDGGGGGELPENAGGAREIPSDAGAGGGADPGDAGGAGGAESGAKASPIQGRVIGGQGQPLSRVIVSVNGVSTTTDAQGAFELEEVPASYDLLVIEDSEEAKQVVLIDALTTREPVVTLMFHSAHDRKTLVSGLLSGGGGFPIPKGSAGQVALLSEEQKNSWRTDLLAGHFAYNLAPEWAETETLTGELIALEWVTSAAGPTSYTGFGSKPITLTDGENAMGDATALALVDPKERTITGKLTVSGKPTLTSTLTIGQALEVELPLKAGDFSVVVPNVDRSTSLVVNGQYPGDIYVSAWATPPTGNSDWNVALPGPVIQTLPIDKAAKLPLNTKFSWETAANIYSMVMWNFDEWAVFRVTSGAETTLPDLSAFGIDLSGSSAGWTVYESGNVDSPELFLDLQGARIAARTEADHSYSNSVVRLVTFAQ